MHFIIEKLLKFLQAVIDDNRKKVKEMLTECPQLLLAELPKDLVIESHCTWRKIYGKNALILVAEKKLYTMAFLLLHYFKEYVQQGLFTADQIKAIAQYELPRYKNKNFQGDFLSERNILTNAYFEKLFLNMKYPIEYKIFFQWLVNVIANDFFYTQCERFATMQALYQLRKLLRPEKAIHLAQDIDELLLLYAAHKAFDDHFEKFQCANQRIAFYINIIGFLQSILPHETGKKICYGLTYFHHQDDKYYLLDNKDTNNETEIIKCRDEPFYRQKDTLSGLGYNRVCSLRGHMWNRSETWNWTRYSENWKEKWDKESNQEYLLFLGYLIWHRDNMLSQYAQTLAEIAKPGYRP